ncbi:annexin A1-like [Aplochiton taeniatus]
MAFFKKFFNSVIHDKHEDGPFTVKGTTNPAYFGTVLPYPNFSASKDAAELEKAIKAKGVNEDGIISILLTRNNEQRQQIKTVYEQSTGKALSAALKSVLRSHLEDAALALLMTPAQFDVHELTKATKGLGTSEDVLSEILASRTNKEICEIKRVFKEVNHMELEDVIKSETSGDFSLALLALLKANKNESDTVDMDLAKRDAEILFEAGEKAKGTNVSAFIDILTTRNGAQLSKTFQKYSGISDKSLPRAIEMELKGDIENCLIDIVKCAWSKPAFFAERLHLAMKGLGTRENSLIRVLVSRSEVDLKKVVDEYKIMYKQTLKQAIVEETKGDFQKILLGLCGPQ